MTEIKMTRECILLGKFAQHFCALIDAYAGSNGPTLHDFVVQCQSLQDEKNEGIIASIHPRQVLKIYLVFEQSLKRPWEWMKLRWIIPKMKQNSCLQLHWQCLHNQSSISERVNFFVCFLQQGCSFICRPKLVPEAP
jgi:hypothetical protein